MAKVFLTCLASFKPFSFDEIAVGLFLPIMADLQRLRRSLEGKPLSLQWCCETTIVVKKIHSRFLLYLERSKVSTSWEGVNVPDEYMRATLDLLDLCNLLKSATSRLDRSRMMVDFMVKRLEDDAFSTTTSKIEFERLENYVCNKLFDVKKLGEMNFSEERVSKVKWKTRSSMHVIQAIQSTMSKISLLVFCSFLHQIPIKIDKGFHNKLPNLDSFSDSVQKLVTSFVEKFQDVQDRGKPVLYEIEMIEDAFATLKAQAEEAGLCRELSEAVKMLKKRSLALKDGLELFESVVDELFEEVIKGRKQVIDFIYNHNC